MAEEQPGNTVESTALTTTSGPGLMRPVADVAAIRLALQAYKALSESIIEDSDKVKIGERTFVKRSGWRKMALAYGVSFEQREVQLARVDLIATGALLRAEICVRAIAPNGRFADGIGICDLHERCCAPNCENKRQYHRHCPAASGAFCEQAHFSNPEHDLPATAYTRAASRACSDLFGLGEVSADEITDRDVDSGPQHRERYDDAPVEVMIDAETLTQIRELLAQQTTFTEQQICAGWQVDTLEALTLGQGIATVRRLTEANPSEPTKVDPTEENLDGSGIFADANTIMQIRRIIQEAELDEAGICRAEGIEDMEQLEAYGAPQLLRRLQAVLDEKTKASGKSGNKKPAKTKASDGS